jgi:hypothetical protein
MLLMLVMRLASAAQIQETARLESLCRMLIRDNAQVRMHSELRTFVTTSHVLLIF